MKKYLSVKTESLTVFLSIFDETEFLVDLEMGDTWHPSSGYVDEKILGSKPTVADVLESSYDFRGLVGFSAEISAVKVMFLDNESTEKEHSYRIIGDDMHLRNLSNKIIEKNASEPNLYSMELVSYWE